jgi:AhpD family alkylhydroperoxidase
MYNQEYLAKLEKTDYLTPRVMEAFWALDKAAVTEGAIPVEHKELIAFVVPLRIRCPYRTEIHTANVFKVGASGAEIVEAARVPGAAGCAHSSDARAAEVK